jgi:hypothetical protein
MTGWANGYAFRQLQGGHKRESADARLGISLAALSYPVLIVREDAKGGRHIMVTLGWKAGLEQYPPVELLNYAVTAEEAGFDLIEASVHFQH